MANTPKTHKFISSRKEFFRSDDLVLRKHLLRKAESNHLAANLCNLSTVYIQQHLYSHTLHTNLRVLQEEEPIFFSESLSISDVPELSCEFPMPKVTLSQALSGGKNIAISGAIGTGKTTCLANFIIEVLEKRCANTKFNEYLPVMLHIQQFSQYGHLPLVDSLSRCLFDENIDLSPPEIVKALSDYVNNGKLLLLIDGLDELRKNMFDVAVTLLQQIHIDYPNLPLVTTCGPFYAGSLHTAGFSVLPIAPPDKAAFQKSLKSWLSLWERLNNDFNSSFSQESDFIKFWFNQQYNPPSFSEITFLILAFLHRDYIPQSRPFISYLKRNIEKRFEINDFLHLVDVLAGFDNFSSSVSEISRNLTVNHGTNPIKSAEIVGHLIDSGILIKQGDYVRFSNPSLLSQLLSLSPKHQTRTNIDFLLYSPVDNYAATCANIDRNYVAEWIASLDPTDARKTAFVLNHLFAPTVTIPDLSATFPNLVKYIIADNLPLSSKIKFASIINYANPAIFSKLLAKIENFPGSDNRRICAFFYGFLPLQQHLKYLLEVIGHSQKSVTVYGALSLLVSNDQKSINYLADIIQSAPEKYGRLLSELCSQYPINGYKLILELAEIDNASLRRFAIYGLRLISEKWASDLLDEISRNDKAWIIRDAAVQAMNNRHKPETYSPPLLPNFSDNPIFLSAFSRQSVLIAKDTKPSELLFGLIDSGSNTEALQAIQYLFSSPDETSLKKLKHLISYENPLREIAAQALFEISVRI